MDNTISNFDYTLFTQLIDECTAHGRSCWQRGVNAYVRELFDCFDEYRDFEAREATENLSFKELERLLLNGAGSWSAYSYGGSSLIFDCDIASRLCTPSELKRKRGGELPPSRFESWLDVQARALYGAFRIVAGCYRQAHEN